MMRNFLVKILNMTKYTSLPNLVRLGQWEQVSPSLCDPLHNRLVIELMLSPACPLFVLEPIYVKCVINNRVII